MKYRKKPVVIEVTQFDGTNHEELSKWSEGQIQKDPYYTGNDLLIIPTLEGDMRANINDYIIKGVKGEFYPCKPDIFEATYELVDE